MGEILHSQLLDLFEKTTRKSLSSTYLIHGQEMIVEQAMKQLLAHLLNGQSEALCCEKVEGVAENLPDVLERLNTFALLDGPKIIIFKDANLFAGKTNPQQLVERIVDAWEVDDFDKAAKLFLGWCSRFEVDMDTISLRAAEKGAIKDLIEQLGTEGVDKLVHYCRSQGWPIGGSSDHSEFLRQALAAGFPQDHYLIVTVYSKVPKNLKLYKAFHNHGEIIDCNVPLGERRADKMAQEAVLRDTLDQLMGKAGKRLYPGSFQVLCRLTGFDPRTFIQNVQKLIDYTGDRREITAEDIQAVLKRTKVDPIFELTNAVADRNLDQAFFYLNSLLDSKWHPLQLLSAMSNQIRKLLVAKSFTISDYGSSWSRGMGYPQFQKSVIPSIMAYDKQSIEQTSHWREFDHAKGKKGHKQKKEIKDVFLAPNPKSPYPVYQTLVKSENYSLRELVSAMDCLSQADTRLKSTGQDAAMIIRKTIMEICRNTNGP